MTRRRQNATRWNNKKSPYLKDALGSWDLTKWCQNPRCGVWDFLFCAMGLDKLEEEFWHNPDNSKSSLAIERLQVRALRRSRPAGSMVEYSTTVKGLFFYSAEFLPVFLILCWRICTVFYASYSASGALFSWACLLISEYNFCNLSNAAFHSQNDVFVISP